MSHLSSVGAKMPFSEYDHSYIKIAAASNPVPVSDMIGTESNFSAPNTNANLARLKTLEHRFNEKLIGQPFAVSYVSKMIKQIVGGFYDEKAPFGVWLFAGPTGVGKTEMAKMVAQELDIPFYRYDMSEFRQEHTVSRFLGSPPGYVDSHRGGELVHALKKSPFSVVLFDEIEKAHSQITNIFLQLFDEGKLTDSMGNSVSTKHVIFIMTTNLGSREIYSQQLSHSAINAKLKLLFTQRFSAELLGRVHQTVIFNPLTPQSIIKICENYWAELASSIAKRKNLTITWDHQIFEILTDAKINRGKGARDVHRRVQECLFNTLTKGYFDEIYAEGDVIHIQATKMRQLEVRLLMKGKNSSNISPMDPVKEIAAVQELPKEKGIIYLDQRGVSLNEFVGKYAIRISKKNGDGSYSTDPIKIISASEDGKFIYERSGYFSKSEFLLESDSNDKNWALPSPTTSARAFFENLCSDIEDPLDKEKYTQIMRDILASLEVKHLPNEQPIAELRCKCKKLGKTELLPKIDLLEEFFGPIKVKLILKSPSTVKPNPVVPASPTYFKNYKFDFIKSKL